MKNKSYSVIALATFMLVGFVGVSASVSSKIDDREFRYEKIATSDAYMLKLPSGCDVSLIFHKGESVYLSYGSCIDDNTVDDIEDISKSLKCIVGNYDLSEKLKKKKYLYIDIGSPIFHPHIIQSINESKAWPDDIVRHLTSMKLTEHDVAAVYRQILAKEVISQMAYGKFVDLFNGFNCQLTLSEYYLEKFSIEDGFYDRRYLIGLDFFEQKNAKKDFYPKIHGLVAFDMNCYQ